MINQLHGIHDTFTTSNMENILKGVNVTCITPLELMNCIKVP